MRLFLDTADPQQWQTWLPTGLFYGVTTNPLLLERSGQACTLDNLHRLMAIARDCQAQEIQIQTWGNTVEAMVNTGLALATDARNGFGTSLYPDVVIKVPVTRAGTQAAAQLLAQNIRVTLTAVYAAPQVAIAAVLGVDYAAPYLGRIQDQTPDRKGRGREILALMQKMLDRTGNSKTRLLVASLRQAEDLAALAAQGLDTFTISPAIADRLFQVAATEAAAADFERAARGGG
ncbi:MAG: transaldolase family protein [Prochlorothrix sp.]